MRLRVRRLLGVSALYLIFGLQLPGCSGQQQDEEGLEVSGQENENEYADNEDGDNNAYDNNNDDNGYDSANINENATENDLQEIIQEMNGQQTDMAGWDTGEGDAMALQQDMGAQGQMNAGGGFDANMAGAGMGGDMGAGGGGSPIPFQPGGSPAGVGLPELGSKMAYIVERGDTLGKISQRIYGTPGRWQELASLSGISNPSRIFPGDLVYYSLDESAVAFATAYESIQRAAETVQPGDTLATISQRIYGTSTAWRSLWRHNDKIDNPDIVATGTTVYYVPQGALTAALEKAKAQSGKVADTAAKSGKTVAKSNVNTIKDTNTKSTKAASAINTGVNLTSSRILENLTVGTLAPAYCS